MNKSKLITCAYLLWVVALILSSLAIVLVVYAVESFFAGSMQNPNLCQLVLIADIAAVVWLYALVLRRHPERPSSVHLEALSNTLLLSQLSVVVLAAIVDTHPIASMVVLGIFLFIFLVALVPSCMKFIKYARRSFALRDTYPRNQAVLTQVLKATNGPDIWLGGLFGDESYSRRYLFQLPLRIEEKIRLHAIMLLPYTRNERTVADVAQRDSSAEVHALALAKLPYPEAKETLISIAESECSSDEVRLAALKKLPYPEERDAFVNVAASGRSSAVRVYAIAQLSYPADCEVLTSIVEFEGSSDEVHLAAVNKLPYPEERDMLVKIAESKSCAYEVRMVALRKLPLDECSVYEKVIGEFEQAVMAQSGCRVESEGSDLSREARFLRRLYGAFGMKSSLKVSHRREDVHTDCKTYEDWLDCPLCVGGDWLDEWTHEDETTTFIIREFDIVS